MSTIDDELLLDAEENAREIEFIHNYLPIDLKDKFTEEDLYYILDVIFDYYTNSNLFTAEPDKDGFVDINLDEVAAYVVKTAKKDKYADFDQDDVFFIVQAEAEFSNQEDGEEE